MDSVQNFQDTSQCIIIQIPWSLWKERKWDILFLIQYLSFNKQLPAKQELLFIYG